MSQSIKLIIVDDHPVFRRGLREIIEEHKELEVLGEAVNGNDGLNMANELRPDIAIVDVDMPGLNGIGMARELRKGLSPIIVVFLTMYKDEDIFNAAFDLGIKGYVLKDNASDDIIAALKQVASGDVFYSSALNAASQSREDRIQSLLTSKPQLDKLTVAEKRILKLIAEDRTTKEIADVLKISAKTVENHRLNICHKLNLHGSHSLLKFAFDHKSYL